MEAKYVAGLLFSEDKGRVCLILKNKPEWQAGKFNAIGGKIEGSELPKKAMEREFLEETGILISASRWRDWMNLTDRRNYIVSFQYAYATEDELRGVRQMESEKPSVFNVKSLPNNLIPNLNWIIQMALFMENENCNTFEVVERY